MIRRTNIITSWLLLLVLGYLLNVEASWGQERLGLHKGTTHYLFIAVALICLIIHIKQRGEAPPPDRIPPGTPPTSLTRQLMGRLKDFGLRFLVTVDQTLCRPRIFFSRLNTTSATDALAFLLTCAAVGSLVGVLDGSTSLADLWPAALDTTGGYLLATLVTAIGLVSVWWLVRGPVAFRRLFVIQAYFCGALFLLITCCISLVKWILTTPLINPSGTSITSLAFAHLERLVLVPDCTDSDSLGSCLSQYGLPNEPALITMGIAIGLLTIIYYLVLLFGVWYALRRLAHVGYVRAGIAFLLYFILSGSISSIQVASVYRLATTCQFDDLTVYPTLNPGPLKWVGPMTCGDYPLVEIGHREAAYWPRSQAEHNTGLLAKIGDVLSVRLFLENGAADNADPRTAVARNVRAMFHLRSASPQEYVLSVTVTSDNAATISSSDITRGGDCTIRTSTPALLQYLPGTTSMLVSRESVRALRLTPTSPVGTSGVNTVDVPDGVLANGLTLSSLAPGYGQTIQLLFRLIVVAPAVTQ